MSHRPFLSRRPAKSAVIARSRLVRTLDTDRVMSQQQPQMPQQATRGPAPEELLGRLLDEALPADRRAQ